MIKLSIIIPVYNTAKYLTQCITSCVSQIQKDVEVILVNDGSTDNSQNIIDEYSGRYPYIRIIIQSNQGLSAARNNALNVAKGQYVWFVDSDDWIEPCAIQKVMCAIEEEYDVISIKRVSDRNRIVDHNYYTRSGKQILLNGDCEFGAVFYICKRNIFDNYSLRFKVGIFHEDLELIPRLLYYSGTVCCISEPLYNVTINPTSITRTINPKKSYDLIVVANSLYGFKSEVVTQQEIKSVFDKIISIAINNSFANIIKDEFKQQKLFNDYFYQHRIVLNSLKKCSIKYKLEYFLFKVFPHRCVNVYKFLKIISN